MMTRYTLTLIAAIVMLSIGGGCTTCHHAGFDAALAPPGMNEDTTMQQRNRIHVFIINGNDPVNAGSLCKLRKSLNDAGYAKVSYGGLLHGGTFESMIVKAHCEDPESRFILIGNGFGVGLAESLASRLTMRDITVETVAIAPLTLPGLSTNTTTVAAKLTTLSADASTQVVMDMVAQACQAIPPVSATTTALAMIDDPAPRPGVPATGVEAKPIPSAPRLVPGILTTMPKP